MDKLLKGEELWWNLKPHEESKEAIEKLAEAFKLPMPSGVAIWDHDQRVVAVNDDPGLYLQQARGTPTRSVHMWRQYICRRGWVWSYYYRPAEEGGSVLMFRLPLPNAVEETVEVKEEVEIAGVPPEERLEPVMNFTPKVIRNRVRKSRKIQPRTEWEQEGDGFYNE